MPPIIENVIPQAMLLDSLGRYSMLSAISFFGSRIFNGKFPDYRHNLLFPLVFTPIDLLIQFSATKGQECYPRFAHAIKTIQHCANAILLATTYYAVDKYFWSKGQILNLNSYIMQPLLITIAKEICSYSILGAKATLGQRCDPFDEVRDNTYLETFRRHCWDWIFISECLSHPVIHSIDSLFSSYFVIRTQEALESKKVNKEEYSHLEFTRGELFGEIPYLIKDITCSLAGSYTASKFVDCAFSTRFIVKSSIIFFALGTITKILWGIAEKLKKEIETQEQKDVQFLDPPFESPFPGLT